MSWVLALQAVVTLGSQIFFLNFEARSPVAQAGPPTLCEAEVAPGLDSA